MVSPSPGVSLFCDIGRCDATLLVEFVFVLVHSKGVPVHEDFETALHQHIAGELVMQKLLSDKPGNFPKAGNPTGRRFSSSPILERHLKC